MTSCPISGRKLAIRRDRSRILVAVPDPALVSHVVATTSLTPGEAARVIEDVIAFHAQPVEDYVRARHARLKTYGAKNPEIFARIAEELRAARRGRARALRAAAASHRLRIDQRRTDNDMCGIVGYIGRQDAAPSSSRD